MECCTKMLKGFPKHLKFIVFLSLLCILFIVTPPLNETPARIILGLVLILFLPGFSLTSALFPGKDDLDAVERIAISFGLSIAIVPLLGLALNFTPFGIKLVPILIALLVSVISFTLYAYIRINKLPKKERFTVEFNLENIKKTFYSINECKEIKLIKFNHTVLLFILALIWLIAYLLSTIRSPLPVYVFWISVIFLSFLIVWQIGKVENRFQELIVLSEIVLLGFVLHLIFVLPVSYGLFGRDIHFEYYATKTIAEYGWPIPDSVNILPRTHEYSKWPMIHFLGIIFSNVLGMKLFSVENSFTIMKWTPSIISSCTPLIFFILVKKIYNNTEVSLLATLGATALFYNNMLHSLFVRETIAFVIFLLFLYFYVSYLTDPKKKTATVSVLMILSMIALVFSHHLTFFMLIIFLVILFFDLYLCDTIGRIIFKLPKPSIELNSTNLTILILAFTCFLAYLMYVAEPVFKTLVSMIEALFFEPYTSAYLIKQRISRDQVILFLRIFFTVFFSILMIKQAFKKERTFSWDIFGLLWGMFSFSLIMSEKLIMKVIPVGVSRIETFAWSFILISGCYAIYNLKNRNLFKYLLIFFIIFNLFLIPPYIYDHDTQPYYKSNQVSMSYNLSDYKGIGWLDGKGKVVGDLTTMELLGGLKQTKVFTDADIYEGNLDKLHSYDWLVVREENFKLVKVQGKVRHLTHLSRDTYNKLENLSALAGVYCNGNTKIYRYIKVSL